jgi:hypothetical protein
MKFVGRTVHSRYTFTPFVIESINFKLTPDSTFEWSAKDGTTRTMSFRDYLRQTHKFELRHSNQPMIRSTKRGRAVYLPVEAVSAPEITAETKQRLPSLCSVPPTDRIRRCLDLVTLLSTPNARGKGKSWLLNESR